MPVDSPCPSIHHARRFTMPVDPPYPQARSLRPSRHSRLSPICTRLVFARMSILGSHTYIHVAYIASTTCPALTASIRMPCMHWPHIKAIDEQILLQLMVLPNIRSIDGLYSLGDCCGGIVVRFLRCLVDCFGVLSRCPRFSLPSRCVVHA